MANEYDISRAFKRIENDLMDSMMRNLKRHQAEELKEGYNWEQWQALQLKELERYRKQNAKKFGGDFTQINNRIEDLFKQTSLDAQTKEEAKILDDIRKGKYYANKKDVSFFNVNDQKLNVLIERTKADFSRAEYAVLRKANDQYRQIIFDAQVYGNITNDYAKAVDMATHDYIKNGLQSIEYKSKTTGNVVSRHNISDYAEMAIRTGNKRAYLMGEGNAHDAYGIHTIRVNKRTQACPKCVGFLGKVMVDDVYAGGTAKEAMKLGVPLLSQAIHAGFLHPNCKDIYSMYIPNVSKPADPWTQKEIEDIVGDYNAEQELKHAEDMQESYARMAKYSLDKENKAKYQARADGWQLRADDIKAGMPQVPIISTVVPPPVATQSVQPTPPPEPTPPPVKSFEKQSSGNTVYKSKGLTNKPQGTGKSWEMTLNPTVSDLEKQIDKLETFIASHPDVKDSGEVVLKAQYAQIIGKITDEFNKAKASGANIGKLGGLSKKKAKYDKKWNILNKQGEIKDLSTQLADKEAEKIASLPPDKTFSGIWKDDVKLSDWKTKHDSGSISDKDIWYTNKINEWQTKGIGYGFTQAEIDAKVKSLEDMANLLDEFNVQGGAYYNQAFAFDKEIDALKVAIDKKQAELDALTAVKKKAKKGAITEAQRNKATFYYDILEADKDYRKITSDAWLNSSATARRSGWQYTYGSGAHNRPLRGFDKRWGDSNFKGIGNVPLDNEGRPNTLDLADMIEKSKLPEDKWFARGLYDNNNEAIVAYLGEDRDWLLNAPESEIRAKLIGKVVTDEAFQSHGVVKSAGWGGHQFETFAPKGTEALYVEPFSHFNHSNYDSKSWDGKQTQGRGDFGESEMLFQAMTDYEIVDISVSGVGGWRSFNIKQQVVNQRSAKEIKEIWKKRMAKIGKTI